MNVKGGTQTWSAAAQSSSLRGDGAQQVSAEDYKKRFGDKSVGDVANQAADPNWVDPRKTRKVGNNSLDKDAFLKLMLTQMKNQDPSNPMQSHEMAAQLAQFTSLEQLFNINETLAGMKKGQDPTQNFQALNFIGKAVSGDTAKLVRSQGDKEHELRFTLPSMAKDVHIDIKGASGEIVRSYNMSNLEAGSQRVVWNGLKDDGLEARPGEYSFSIEAKTSNGAKLLPRTTFEGRITGVNYTKEGPVLLIGNQSIRLADVKKIVDSDQLDVQKTQIPKALDLSKQDKAIEDKRKNFKPAVNAQPESEQLMANNNLENVVMAGQLQDKLAKQAGKVAGEQ
jgi:flagellar basal-body rod modification protein FlgD